MSTNLTDSTNFGTPKFDLLRPLLWVMAGTFLFFSLSFLNPVQAKTSKKTLKKQRLYAATKSKRKRVRLKTRNQIGLKPEKRSRTAKKLRLLWRLGLDGRSYENETDTAQLSIFSAQTKLRYRLAPSLSLRSDVSARLGTGRSQSRFGEYTPVNGFKVREAIVRWTPIYNLGLEAGALGNNSKMPNLISKGAFPGVSQFIRFKSKYFRAKFKALQAIPTSTTLSTRAIEKEETPYFFTESFEVTVKPAKEFSLTGYVRHFSFVDLPSAVAQDSALQGNTVFEIGPNDSAFRYEFNGWAYGAESKVKLHRRFTLLGGIFIVTNSEAPEAFNQGQYTFGGARFNFKDVEISTVGDYFFTESDVTPAFYNSSAYGHNNRQGFGAKIGLKFKKLGFNLSMSYVEAQLINPTANQSDQRVLGIRLETLYDKLL